VDQLSHGQNKPAQKKNTIPQEDPTPADYAQLRQTAEIYGTLTYLDLGTGKLNLRVEISKQVPNNSPQVTKNLNAQQQALMRAQQQIMRDYQSIMASRNPSQQQQRMQKLMLDYQNLQVRMVQAGMGQASLFKTVTVAKEFEFDVSDKLRVARVELPQEYDDKGSIVTYTKEELKKKRDDVLPGYTAKPEELQPGQKVKLYLGTPPKKKKTTDNKVDTTVEKVDTKTPDDPKTSKFPTGPGKTTEEQLPFVRMALIYQEPDPSTLPKNVEKKKKKNNN